jgi:NAD(P)-dependent dehydrogenase (short-subunit alcohol dehydrogenase family)
MHARGQGEVIVKQLDLADLQSVDAFAKDVGLSEKRIDYLILNAGLIAPPLYYTENLPSYKSYYTQDEFELTIGVNHFGHQALTTALLEKLKSQVTCFVEFEV